MFQKFIQQLKHRSYCEVTHDNHFYEFFEIGSVPISLSLQCTFCFYINYLTDVENIVHSTWVLNLSSFFWWNFTKSIDLFHFRKPLRMIRSIVVTDLLLILVQSSQLYSMRNAEILFNIFSYCKLFVSQFMSRSSLRGLISGLTVSQLTGQVNNISLNKLNVIFPWRKLYGWIYNI